MVKFPDGFLWGAGTYAYQVEGAAFEDGKGESIWDRFCSLPGTILNGDTGLVACDHYHRYRDDIALMKDLGLKAYVFSIAWPRVIPQGRGEVNSQGLDFYKRLLDSLLEAGIEPFVTLYHWDLPQALEDRLGGWLNRETAYAFAEYTDVVTKHLGDRVRRWLTLNEPAVTAFDAYESGEHAPGYRNPRQAWRSTHHFLLAHGLAVPIIRANGHAETQVGITLNFTAIHPATSSEADKSAAHFLDGKYHRWFLDPIFRGEYPADVVERLGDLMPEVLPGDLEIISAPLDYLGANYYTRSVVGASPDGPDAIDNFVYFHQPESEYTTMNWEVYPPGLYEHLMRLHRDYAIPAIYTIENGAAFPDTPTSDGHVHDPRRTAFLREHFLQLHRALSDGVPLRGHCVWALMDNFEWSLGYSQRFGITYIDYQTQQRIIKDSGYWYKDVIAANAVE
ncbi:MAG TPA: GH1 family beta-glucosidase [Ktedonobacteraceae bacterium]|nr:GH1 family beta-glucosidase [Ktedonobacteraceae bacterium]